MDLRFVCAALWSDYYRLSIWLSDGGWNGIPKLIPQLWFVPEIVAIACSHVHSYPFKLRREESMLFHIINCVRCAPTSNIADEFSKWEHQEIEPEHRCMTWIGELCWTVFGWLNFIVASGVHSYEKPASSLRFVLDSFVGFVRVRLCTYLPCTLHLKSKL